MDNRLKDRIALITGAGSGLGRATALRFAASGARVVCADLRSGDSPIEAEIQQKYGKDRAMFVKCNVMNEEEIKTMVAETVKWGGRLDILCTYAGVATETAHGLALRCHDTPTEDFDRTWAINTRGVWLSCKYALQQMLAQEPLPENARGERTRGRIVNAASMLGLVALAGGPNYIPAKHAVVGMTKQMAVDYATDRIHVNCLCPGFVKSPMISSLVPDADSEAALGSTHPWNALGRPEDVADAALFLASDEAAWVTGHAMVIDGAYTCR